ncbi:cytochrome-c peroxidase [Bizionia myxarmorum]|uniref:Cytochrome-c peroxidase n=1 Tax=Bizionia myxarmorum TaxID=291186 RepID=A0A5D0RBP6_9FLAO|nr:cytochrome c peroxidase [Bizionia myxarmorum]TYB78932.1 cytochrome-c peroxidase [Bizionia myxarmorum]
MTKLLTYSFLLFCFLLTACSDEGTEEYVNKPTAQPLEIPPLFAQLIINPVIPFDNPQTIEGIALGKKLFFDPILSANNTQACATCHNPQNAFTDSSQFSVGIDGNLGIRNSMPLFNLAWNYDEQFFWDGRSFSLEHQALVPVEDPVEMHNTWETVISRLQQHPEYPNLFSAAFGDGIINKEKATKAIAQFERTLISANSKFDNYLLGLVELSPQETNGLNIFMDEDRGDCFHCHGNPNNPLWTDNMFHNNGLDATITDIGLGAFTGDPADNGKFKSPSLRNLKYTAPFMHDGRFASLDDVINHYSEGLKNSPTIDPLMKKVAQGGVQLTNQDKADLKAFLLSLSDASFVNNPDFRN